MVSLAPSADAPMAETTTGVSGNRDLLDTTEQVPLGKLEQEIEALIPRLRRYARALTRDPAAADDLVQETLARALAKLQP
jgi:DNA-directed RNA polymerase specialized sigma24 family protein